MALWKIVRLESKSADGFVITAHWEATLIDGKYAARSYGACGFDGELVTPYEDLTEDQVLGWIWANCVDKNDIEEGLIAQIEKQKNPITVNGIPWADLTQND